MMNTTPRIAVLTTTTPHHIYFVQELVQHGFSVALVLAETRPFPYRKLGQRYLRQHWRNPLQALLLNPYFQRPYRRQPQHAYEMRRFFAERQRDAAYPEAARVEEVNTVNTPQAEALLRECAPDVIVLYGTGLVKPHIYEIAPVALNLHGGWLPDYRGLDTNLWALWRGEPHKMAVTLHKVASAFDTGDIVYMEALQPQPDWSLDTLRYYTTLTATELTLRALQAIRHGTLAMTPQPAGGQYFSFFPYLLRPLVDWKLRRYAQTHTTR